MNKKLIIIYFYFLLLTLVPFNRVHAGTHLQVAFEATPLFSEASFMPGDTVTRSATTTNLTTESIPIAVKAENIQNADGLGDMMTIIIKNGATTLYTNTLTNFLNESLIPLGTLGSGAQARYDFSVRFAPETGNPYQEKSVQFDILIGISGEGTVEEGCISNCGKGGSSGNGGTSGGSSGTTTSTSFTGGQGGDGNAPDELGEILGAFTHRILPKSSAPAILGATASNSETTRDSAQTASVFSSLSEVLGAWGTCFVYWLIIIIIIWVLWFLYRTWNNNWERERITREEFVEKRIYFFIAGLVTAIVIAYLIPYPCIIPPLAFVLALFVIWFFINRAFPNNNSHTTQGTSPSAS